MSLAGFNRGLKQVLCSFGLKAVPSRQNFPNPPPPHPPMNNHEGVKQKPSVSRTRPCPPSVQEPPGRACHLHKNLCPRAAVTVSIAEAVSSVTRPCSKTGSGTQRRWAIHPKARDHRIHGSKQVRPKPTKVKSRISVQGHGENIHREFGRARRSRHAEDNQGDEAVKVVVRTLHVGRSMWLLSRFVPRSVNKRSSSRKPGPKPDPVPLQTLQAPSP